jgi:hypothetical protein
MNISLKFGTTPSTAVGPFDISLRTSESTGILVNTGTNPLNGDIGMFTSSTGIVGIFDGSTIEEIVGTNISYETLNSETGYPINDVNCGTHVAVIRSVGEFCSTSDTTNLIEFNSTPTIKITLSNTIDPTASLRSTMNIYGHNGTPNPSITTRLVELTGTGTTIGSIDITNPGKYSFSFNLNQTAGSSDYSGKSATLSYTECPLS